MTQNQKYVLFLVAEYYPYLELETKDRKEALKRFREHKKTLSSGETLYFAKVICEKVKP